MSSAVFSLSPHVFPLSSHFLSFLLSPRVSLRWKLLPSIFVARRGGRRKVFLSPSPSFSLSLYLSLFLSLTLSPDVFLSLSPRVSLPQKWLPSRGELLSPTLSSLPLLPSHDGNFSVARSSLSSSSLSPLQVLQV